VTKWHCWTTCASDRATRGIGGENAAPVYM